MEVPDTRTLQVSRRNLYTQDLAGLWGGIIQFPKEQRLSELLDNCACILTAKGRTTLLKRCFF